MSTQVLAALLAFLVNLPGEPGPMPTLQFKQVKEAKEPQGLIDCEFDALNVYRCTPVDYSLLGKEKEK